MRRTILLLAVTAFALAPCGGVPDAGERPQASSTSSAPPTPSGSPSPETVVVQQGNDRPMVPIELQTLDELTGNRIGDVFPLDRNPRPCGRARDDWSFTHVADLGLTWVRISTDRMEWEQAQSSGDYSRFRINHCQDALISLFAKHDIEMVFTIVYWDPKLHADRPPDYRNEEEVQLYLDYARFLVRHFRDRIRYFEILNEAHVYVRLPDYLELIRRVVPVIRKADPRARIVLDGTSTLLYPHIGHYLFRLLRSDVTPLIDGIALHPMYGASPQFTQTREYYEGYPALVAQIKDAAEAHGFSGEYFVEEMVWRTTRNVVKGEHWTYTPIVAAKYYARAIVMHRGMDIWAGIGGESYDRIPPIARAVRNLSTVMDGAEPTDMDVQIQTEVMDIMSYGFSLPNGDRMLALWTNGAAIDEDAGVAATLTFTGQPPDGAIGIDPLYGFQQELSTQQMGGDLVVPDLLVKDYPIFVYLVEPTI